MTKIIADTTSGLPLDLAKRLGIAMIPQLVVFGEQTFRDDNEITTSEFLQKLKSSSTLPKTAAPLHTMYFPYFSEASQTGETVIVIAPTGKMSGTVRSIETARQSFPNADIRIIDTLTIAGCLAEMILKAQELVQIGKTPDEIESAIRAMIPHSRIFFVVDTLEYLQKGGRIGGARALLGELLQVKPILQIHDGQAAPFEQERTKKRAVARLIDITCEQLAGIKDPRLCVMHVDADQEAQALRDQLSTRLNIPEIPLYILPPAIIVHAGPKALAVGFFA
jgi:DegV family protein with EDD domain